MCMNSILHHDDADNEYKWSEKQLNGKDCNHVCGFTLENV